jgi:PD-(D/E)XK endonuclease
MLSTNQKGAIAESAIAAAAIKLGIRVLKPLDDGGRYDLVFDVAGTIFRVQCKWAVKRGDVVAVRCYTNRRAAEGQRRTFYSEAEIDLLVAYCMELDSCYALPAALVSGRQGFHLRLSPAKNNQSRGIVWASDYRLGAIAQLGERLSGTQEVAGSSPASSTPSRPSARAASLLL